MKSLYFLGFILCSTAALAQSPQWTPTAANDWYARQPWILGSNYIQSNTSNQFDMWQSEYFDTERIDLELTWAERLGMNTLRVGLQDLLWKVDSGGLKSRMGKLLGQADKHKMRVIFVLLDSSGDPFPEPGRQRTPKPGVRNTTWAQSPGQKGMSDPKQIERVLSYVKEAIAAFQIDKRILAWDLWNEPDNMNAGTFGPSEMTDKLAKVQALLPRVFEYARAGLPTQPLTSTLLGGDWSSAAKLSPIQKTQIDLSDIVSFQAYDGPEDFEKRVKWIQAFGRPVVCTGYLARSKGNTFQAILPIAQKNNIGAISDGLVSGKSQTFLPWDSWQTAYVNQEPDPWYQDIFRSNGIPYKQEEVDYIKQFAASNIKPVVSRKK